MQSDQRYLTLSPNCSLRLLEQPCIYDRAHDELYELDREAGDFVARLPLPVGDGEIERADTAFMEYCLEEGLFSRVSERVPQRRASQSPVPSLRYLLLHITTRCNLTCAHCFLDDVEPLDLPLEQIVRAMEEFDELQGLRLLVSGGEPLLHPRFWEINDLFERFSFRTILLSNGTVLHDPETARRLRAQEVQVSLDGIGASHDVLRGPGAYQKALRGLENLIESGTDVSVATMVHSGNIGDFDELEDMVKRVGAKEWNIDVPARAGRWLTPGAVEATPEEAASVMARGFGGGSHFSCEADWACGAHLCAIMADGTICKCGFYANSPAASLAGGLENGWRAVPRMKLGQLRCDCEFVEQCRGGCRYRAEMAGDRLGRDPVMCAGNGVQYQTSRRR